MESTQQVAWLFQILILVGPIAAYLIVLGLLNSQPAPILIDARKDFLILAAALGPLLFHPAWTVIQLGQAWVILPAAVCVLGAVRLLLPREESGWVVYNSSAGQIFRLIRRSADDLGLGIKQAGPSLELPSCHLAIHISPVPLLRNVSCHLKITSDAADKRDAGQAVARELRNCLSSRLKQQHQIPSIAGASLLLVGVAVMLLPLWMMSRHSDAVAQVVSQFLFG